MEIEITVLVLLIIVCAITYSFEIVFGLAGTILMLMLMSFVMETRTLVIFSVLPQILVAVIGLYRSPRTVNIRFLGGMLLFAFIGSVAGMLLFYSLSTGVFQLLLACAITLFGLYLVAAPRLLKMNRAVARVMDTLAGVSQALFGISGPIAMTRLLTTFDDKVVVRNYALAFFLVLNLVRASAYVSQGTISADIGMMMLVAAPVLVLVLWNANHLHFRVNETVFRKVVAWMILLGGLSLFLH